MNSLAKATDLLKAITLPESGASRVVMSEEGTHHVKLPGENNYVPYDPSQHVIDPGQNFAAKRIARKVEGRWHFLVHGQPANEGGHLPDTINDPMHGTLKIHSTTSAKEVPILGGKESMRMPGSTVYRQHKPTAFTEAKTKILKALAEQAHSRGLMLELKSFQIAMSLLKSVPSRAEVTATFPSQAGHYTGLPSQSGHYTGPPSQSGHAKADLEPRAGAAVTVPAPAQPGHYTGSPPSGSSWRERVKNVFHPREEPSEYQQTTQRTIQDYAEGIKTGAFDPSREARQYARQEARPRAISRARQIAAGARDSVQDSASQVAMRIAHPQQARTPYRARPAARVQASAVISSAQDVATRRAPAVAQIENVNRSFQEALNLLKSSLEERGAMLETGPGASVPPGTVGVVGNIKSGKPVFMAPHTLESFNAHHKDWTAQDHKDASKVHLNKLGADSLRSNPQTRKYHELMGTVHSNMGLLKEHKETGYLPEHVSSLDKLKGSTVNYIKAAGKSFPEQKQSSSEERFGMLEYKSITKLLGITP